MKYIQLKLTDELHKHIKIKAAEADKSMHQYVLDCVFLTCRHGNKPNDCKSCKQAFYASKGMLHSSLAKMDIERAKSTSNPIPRKTQ